jgi:hypothetical protein
MKIGSCIDAKVCIFSYALGLKDRETSHDNFKMAINNLSIKQEYFQSLEMPWGEGQL